jgi:hypothetical protein
MVNHARTVERREEQLATVLVSALMTLVVLAAKLPVLVATG